MNAARQAQAEILKVARLLDCDPERLSYLKRVPAADIRVLREDITEMLFTSHQSALLRLAAASRILPVGLVASLGQHAFGPMLSARIAGLLEPERAIEIGARLPTDFLADVAVELDPRRARDVIAGMPADQIAEITCELVRREEYVTMGRFVGHLGNDALAAAVVAMDDRALLQTAFVMEEKPRLEDVVALLDEDRIARLIETAETEGLWADLVELLGEPFSPAAAAAQ